MRKAPLYSASRSRRGKKITPGAGGRRSAPVQSVPDTPARPGLWKRFANFLGRHERATTLVGATLIALAALSAYHWMQPDRQQLTQKDIDSAVMHTLQTTQLPSKASLAYARIRGSIVLVRALGKATSRKTGKDGGKAKDRVKPDKPDQSAEHDPDKPHQHGEPKENPEEGGIGTGVVIVDKGVILTNLHVVRGARQIKVIFADGTESNARITNMRHEQDLAVLQADTVPENLPPATLRSTGDLNSGDEVIAVGFPFGIGPSVSQGVISGMKREFKSRDGRRTLRDLIQFDAAANPGNSGGPLVTMDGSVVGIVTAILNPTEHRTFAGIGFAVPIESAAGAAGASPF